MAHPAPEFEFELQILASDMDTLCDALVDIVVEVLEGHCTQTILSGANDGKTRFELRAKLHKPTREAIRMPVEKSRTKRPTLI